MWRSLGILAFIVGCDRGEPSSAPSPTARATSTASAIGDAASALKLDGLDLKRLERVVAAAGYRVTASGTSSGSGTKGLRVKGVGANGMDATVEQRCGGDAAARITGLVYVERNGCTLGVEVRKGVRAEPETSATLLRQLMNNSG
jgi:hypothetical protein